MIVRHLPEPELCRRLINSDEQAFREVFDRFHRKIYQYSFNFLKDRTQSEEIVQNTFLNFWLHREQIEPTLPVAPLLFTIARRTLIDVWRKSAASKKFRSQIWQFIESVSNETEEHVMMEDLQRVTKDAMSQLNERQRKVFMLSRQDGLSYDEIAERMHISRNTVKYHLVSALKILKTHFGKHGVLSLFSFLFF